MASTVRIDMTGKKYGKLTVLSENKDRNKNGHITYMCECECGTKKSILGASIRIGATKSCGCAVFEANGKHGMGGTPTHRIWVGMRSRCTNKNDPNYKNYGGRGVSVCSIWDDFGQFLTDMGVKPYNLSIDRIDNRGNYEPTNCKWSTSRDQALNRRNTIMVLDGGEKRYVYQMASKWGLSESGARKRVYRSYVKNSDGTFVKSEDL